MHNTLFLKLDRTGWQRLAEREGVTLGEPRLVHPGADILSEGTFAPHPSLLLAGIACRYKMLGDGRRAIVAFLVPGDFVSPCFQQDNKADFGVSALTVCEVAELPRLAERALDGGSTELLRALLRVDLVDRAIQRMWLANIGQCNADKRLAHLLCELRHRLTQVGLADARGVPFPMTQADLADALGLSQVHVNRVMQHLKELGLVRTANRIVQFPHPDLLEAFADFDPAYLSLESSPLHP
jgi:CRP-like cAMP-binding protein